MAFQLRPDESVVRGFKRLSRNELDDARKNLRRRHAPSDEVIHDARTSVKKARAIIQLIDDDGGSRGLGRSEKRLRAANRVLSERRDADVMKETLAWLHTRHPQLFSEHT